MLQKTMKIMISKKINEWIKTIDDKEVVKAIKTDLIITGGCFTSMIQNEEPNDYDCYFRTKETVLVVAEYYATKWNERQGSQENKIGHSTKVMVLDGANPSKEILSYYNIGDISESSAVMISNTPPERVKMIFPSDGVVGVKESQNEPSETNTMSTFGTIEELDELKTDTIIENEKESYFPVFISSNAISLSDKIQLIVRFYGEPDQIHDTFDFIHTSAYCDFSENKVVVPEIVWEATINKTLIYTGSRYPVCSVFRLRKFVQRGWKINAGQMLKMCLQISNLDLNNVSTLEDQLVGVDSVYFMNMIKQFRKMEEKEGFELTAGYVISLIDKIF